MDAHDTHCCVDHGCKYCDPDCPIVHGERKQRWPCEGCDGTEAEKQEHIDALWDFTHNPRTLSPDEQLVAWLVEKYRRIPLQMILADLKTTGFSTDKISEILGNLKHL